MKTVAFFSINEGVGQTSLVYHLAWMYRDLGLSVLAADLDPQASLTRMFLEDYRLGEFWPDGPLAVDAPSIKPSGRCSAVRIIWNPYIPKRSCLDSRCWLAIWRCREPRQACTKNGASRKNEAPGLCGC